MGVQPFASGPHIWIQIPSVSPQLHPSHRHDHGVVPHHATSMHFRDVVVSELQAACLPELGPLTRARHLCSVVNCGTVARTLRCQILEVLYSACHPPPESVFVFVHCSQKHILRLWWCRTDHTMLWLLLKELSQCQMDQKLVSPSFFHKIGLLHNTFHFFGKSISFFFPPCYRVPSL